MPAQYKALPAPEYKAADMTDGLRKGSDVYVRATVDEITDTETIIVKSYRGYFYGMTLNDIVIRPVGQWEDGRCSNCGCKDKTEPRFCRACGSIMEVKK